MTKAIAEVTRQASPSCVRWPKATGQRQPRHWRALAYLILGDAVSLHCAEDGST